jgi:hypothetical protein
MLAATGRRPPSLGVSGEAHADSDTPANPRARMAIPGRMRKLTSSVNL